MLMISPVKADDLTCMAKAIYFEAGGERLEGKIAVGHVILNRMKSPVYPNNVCAVVYQRNYKSRGCQFSWSCRSHKVTNQARWHSSLSVAKNVLAKQTHDYSKGSTSFNNRKFRNKNLVHVVTIGNHYFYKNKIVLARSNYNE